MHRGNIFSLTVAVLGVLVGLGFVYIGIGASLPADETPPLALRVFLIIFGIPFTAISALAVRHALRLAWVRRHGERVNVRLAAEEISDSDSTTYELHIRCDKDCWIAPAYGGKGVRHILQAGRADGHAWLDPRDGKPLSVACAGHVITTYPQVTSVVRERCRA